MERFHRASLFKVIIIPFPFLLLDIRLFDQNAQLRAKNSKLNQENERIQFSGGSGNGTSGDKGNSAKIQAMEKKLMTQQEELTELHKRKGENSQMIVEMNLKLNHQEKLLLEKEQTITDSLLVTNSLRAEVQMLTTSIEELKGINSTVRDEHTALQLAFNALEDRYRKIQEENRQLVDRLIKYKSKDVDKMNEENETFLR